MKEEEEEDVVCNVSYRSFVRRTQLPVAHNILITYTPTFTHKKSFFIHGMLAFVSKILPYFLCWEISACCFHILLAPK